MCDFRIPDAFSGSAPRGLPSAPSVPLGRRAGLRLSPSHLSLATRHSPLATASSTPFFATLTRHPQLAENPATLSPLFATLTRFLTPNSFACHSYTKTPGVGGWGLVFARSLCPRFSSALRCTRLSGLPLSPRTRHYSLSTSNYPLSFHTIPNSFAPPQNLSPVFSSNSKLFLQNTRAGGGVPMAQNSASRHRAPNLGPSPFGARLSVALLTVHYSLLTAAAEPLPCATFFPLGGSTRRELYIGR
jgi:hypothetical protein